jgi:hypothetical protein
MGTMKTVTRLDRVDWAIILLSLTITGTVVYLMLDPDPVMRRVRYYKGLADNMQQVAYLFGRAGLYAELEYRRLLELERIN